MTDSRIVVELIDADGCVYNRKYRDYLVWLFAEYGPTIDAMDCMRLNAKINKQPRPALIDESIEIILKGMRELDIAAFSQQDFVRFEALIEGRGKKGFSEQMRHYLAQVYLLDQTILNHAFIAANQEITKHIESHAGENVLQYLAVGSNRQSNDFDVQGMRNNLTGSIFNDLFHLARHLHESTPVKNHHVGLLPLTMTDILSGMPRGENYRRIITNPSGNHASHYCDVSKLTLLYAMAHDIAGHHSGENITIHFYDNDDGVLDGLYEKLHTKPGSDLLPASVSVVLSQYDGSFHSARTIHGTGVIDKDYHDSVRFMMCMGEINPEFSRKGFVNVAQILDVDDLIQSRKIHSDSKTLAVMLDADGCIYNHNYFYLVMKLMKKHGDKIRSMARDVHDGNELKKFRKELLSDIDASDVIAFTAPEYLELQQYIARHDDFDGCDPDIMEDEKVYQLHASIFNIRQALRYFQEIHTGIGDALLYRANQELFARIIDRAKACQCSRVVFLVGSNRQSVLDDQHCSKINGTGSFYRDLERVTSLLGDKYFGEMRFSLDQFLLADVFGDLDAGESYRHALFNPHDFPHAYTVFDETKASLVYAMLHHIARYYPDIQAVQFYDDRRDIFDAIKRAFGENDEHGLLPQNIPLELINFTGTFSENPVAGVIKGSGDADHGVHHAVKLMAQLAGIDIEDVHRKPSSADIASVVDFKKFAAERSASRPVIDVQFDELTRVRREIVNPRKNIGLFDQPVVRAETHDVVFASASVASAKQSSL